MAFWFVVDLARLSHEKELIERLCEEADWLDEARWRLDSGGRLAVDLTLVVHGATYEAVLTYPTHFPAAPISVRPRDADESWSSHQYANGTLCLEWGPDNWHEGVTGRDMVESLHRLLAIEQNPTEGVSRIVPSRHEVSIGQELRSRTMRFYYGAPLVDQLTPVGVGDTLCCSLHFQRDSILVVAEAVETAEGRWENPQVPPTLRHRPDSMSLIRATVVQTALSASELDAIDSLEKLDEALREDASKTGTGNVERTASLLALAADGTPRLFLVLELDTPKLFPVTTVRSPDPVQRRLSPEHDALSEKRVGIVGLGSVGSKVAVSLARAGVGSFYLVDDDVFLPENVARNALDLCNSAEHKADAVAELASRVSPTATVDVSRSRISGQESNASVNRTLERLASCDLIIDATANARVFNLAAAVAKSSKVPLVWMEVFAGGIGGMLARSRPGKDASPTRIRDVYNAYTAEHPAPDHGQAPVYGALDEQGRVVVATDADVGVIADHATRLAIDVLLDREPSMFPHSLYMVGMSRGWVFEAPFHTIPIETPMDEPVTQLEGANTAAAKDGLEFLMGLLGETTGEHPATA